MTDTPKPVVFLACKVFEGIVEQIPGVEFHLLDYGLHTGPKQLKVAVQEQLDGITTPSTIILGYGLCGNGLHEIKAGIHTLVIPRADDCVAIFMGSRQTYMDQFNNNPGTYYLTRGWFEVGSDPLAEYETLLEKYGPETTEWLMEQQYQHYKRLVFVAQSEEELAAYRPRALEVAKYCQRFGMRYEEFIGSGELIGKLNDLLKDHATPGEDFIVVPPGGILEQSMFMDAI